MSRSEPEPISRSEARESVRGLADEQAALRRVATLVAEGVSPAELFAAVAEEVALVMRLSGVAIVRFDVDGAGTVVGTWSAGAQRIEVASRWPLDEESGFARVRRTRRALRIDDLSSVRGPGAAAARQLGIRAAVGAPIMIDGRVWGMVATFAADNEGLPDRIEDRLADFTSLIATAVSNSQAHEDLRRLVAEQAALRRVATLVARGCRPEGLFAVVAEQVARVIGASVVSVVRYEADGTASERGTFSDRGEPFVVGTRWPLDGTSVVALVREGGRPARIDDYSGLEGTIVESVRRAEIRSTVGSPIVVAGGLWGAMVVSSRALEPLPADTETRLGEFTELVATAISNSEARAEVARLADEQAALRRVATLVARGVPEADIFTAIAEEIGRWLGTHETTMARYEHAGHAVVMSRLEDDRHAVVVAGWGVTKDAIPVGMRLGLEDDSASTRTLRTGGPARIDEYTRLTGPVGDAARPVAIRCVVATPILVEGKLWGAMAAGTTTPEPLPAQTESRLGQFTELMATAIANTQSRAQVERLADQQAALRRVATLVARQPSPQEVFAAVAEEVANILSVDATGMFRYEPDRSATVVADWDDPDRPSHVGTRLPLDGRSIISRVLRTGRPVRIDDYATVTGTLAANIRDLGVRSAVGSPIVVEGELWGTIVAASRRPGPLPADTESRLGEFTELVATAISNIEARTDLAASRTRIVEAADAERRRVVRDLHDGAQSRLVHAVIAFERTRARDDLPPNLRPLVEEGLHHGRGAINELRELAHGIHPAILTNSGLAAAVEVLADRAPLPVEVRIADERYPRPIESAAYFVAAEALTNIAKHARASKARVSATHTPACLRLTVEDDGIGGATRAPGGGIAGLRDRVAALNGVLSIDSPPGAGTRIKADIPLPA